MRRLFCSFTPHHLLSGLLSSCLLLNGSLVAVGQNGESKPSTKTQSLSGLAVGSSVVLKSSDIPLRDGGRQVTVAEYLSVNVERIDGDRIWLASPDGKRRGSVGLDQVVAFDRAIDYFNKEIAKNPRSADAHWTRGRLWAHRFDNNRALADFDQAIQVAPDHAQCDVDRSKELLWKNQIDRALADCDKAIQLDPKLARAYLYRANIWLVQKDQKRAKTDLDMAIQLDPTNWYCWNERSRYWVDFGRNLENALSDMSEAIRLFPSNAASHFLRGDLWARKHQYEKAVADYTEAIRLEHGI